LWKERNKQGLRPVAILIEENPRSVFHVEPRRAAGLADPVRTPIMVVEIFNNPAAMAIVNYSVPADIKDAFNAAFAGENKSAVIAELMRRAVLEREQAARRVALLQSLTQERVRRPPATDRALNAARAERR
jgi:hypothetical protein